MLGSLSDRSHHPSHEIPRTIERGGKTATGIRVPVEVVTALGSSRKPAVRVTIRRHSYRTTVHPGAASS
ncbi:MAG TPA: DUF1905 domain-containing protein [Cryptosporangiaceae bacterium]|nr:DUF1905 domain-containing protein [Cryptosporangiaceae bacterium]